jgi:hypothetical protein
VKNQKSPDDEVSGVSVFGVLRRIGYDKPGDEKENIHSHVSITKQDGSKVLLAVYSVNENTVMEKQNQDRCHSP